MPGTLVDHATVVIGKYDEIVRANRHPQMDTLVAVDECDDDIWGAWGEVMDLAAELGYTDSNMGAEENGRFYDFLYAAYEGWRVALHSQVAMESAWRKWREQT